MFAEIVIPVDVTQIAAARRAIAVAKANVKNDGHILLLHAIAPIPSTYEDYLNEKIDSGFVSTAKKVLAELKESEQLPPSTTIRIDHGKPHRIILDCIKDADNQAIVMSSHNPKLSDIVMGSVAAHVVKHAICSVFVIRHHE